MASRLHIIITASDQATRTFYRFKQNAGKSMESVSKTALPVQRNMEKLFKEVAKDGQKAFKDVEGASDKFVDKTLTDLNKVDKQVKSAFAKMRQHTKDPIEATITLSTGDAIRDALLAKQAMDNIPGEVKTEMKLGGVKDLFTQLGKIRRRLLDKEMKSLTIDVATRGAKEASRALMGLKRDGWKLTAKKW